MIKKVLTSIICLFFMACVKTEELFRPKQYTFSIVDTIIKSNIITSRQNTKLEIPQNIQIPQTTNMLQTTQTIPFKNYSLWYFSIA